MQELVFMHSKMLESLAELVTVHQFKHNLQPFVNVNNDRHQLCLYIILSRSLPTLISTRTRNFWINDTSRDSARDEKYWHFLVTKDIAEEFNGLFESKIYCYLSKLFKAVEAKKNIKFALTEVGLAFNALREYIEEESITYKTVSEGARKFDAVNNNLLYKLGKMYFGTRHVQIQLMELANATLDERDAAVAAQQCDLAILHNLLFDVNSDLTCKAFFYILACEDPWVKSIVPASKAVSRDAEMLFLPSQLTLLRNFLKEAVGYFNISEQTTFAEFKKLYDTKMNLILSRSLK